MKNKKPIFLLIVVVMLLQLVLVPIANGDETSYYRTLEPKVFKFKNTYKLENTGSEAATSIKFTVAVGAVSNSSYQQDISYKVTPWPKYTYVDSFGNVYAEVHIDKINANETKLITVEKEVTNSGVAYSKDIYNMRTDYTEFKKGLNNMQYFEPGEKVESSAPEITAKAAAFDVSKTKVQLAKAIYDFVNLYITYDLNPQYANKGALSAIKTARGVCDEYSMLFTALSRAVGIPARVATGFWIDEPLKPGVWNDVSARGHSWAEFYLPETGWIPVEPTFIYTFNGVRTPNSEYFANLKIDELHLLDGYQQNVIKNEGAISYLSAGGAKINISIAGKAVMPLGSASTAYAFTDISSNWAKSYINQLYTEGILFAKQPGLFKPVDNITRAEFAAFLVNTLRLEPKTAGITFKDVKDNSEYASFIKTAAAYKLIMGDPQGYYKPNDPITRQDAAAIMKRAIDILDSDYTALLEPDFVDSSQISSYAKDAVKLIYNMKIMTGKPGNLFEPKSFTTRAEVSKILDNFINATE